MVNLLQGQNHGLFLDMARGRQWVREYCQNCCSSSSSSSSSDDDASNGAPTQTQKVLNLFAYTCAFSIAALQGIDGGNGATQVINVDMSNGALQTGQRNHNLNGFGQIDGQVRFFKLNVFKAWTKLGRLGPYDLIIVDPPSYQKGSFVAATDYAKVIRRLPGLLSSTSSSPPPPPPLNPGDANCVHGNFGVGHVLLCLNAPELSEAWLRQVVADEAPQLQFVQRLENPPTFPAADPDRALKVLVYQLSLPSSSSASFND